MPIDRCIICGAEIQYLGGEDAVKCHACGNTNMVAEFKSEKRKLIKAQEEAEQYKASLEAAQQENQALTRQVHDALFALEGIQSGQSEENDQLTALLQGQMAEDASLYQLRALVEGISTDQQDALHRILLTVTNGQQDTGDKLKLLHGIADKLLQAQDDIFAKMEAQNTVMGLIKNAQAEAAEKAKIAQEFMQWSQSIHEEDLKRLSRIADSSSELLSSQKALHDKMDALQAKADDTYRVLTDFRKQFQADKLEKREALFQQAEDFQRERKFEAAEEQYRLAIAEGEKSAEIYWRIILCHYGVVYQQAEGKKKWVPTVFHPDLTDPDEMSDRTRLLENVKTEKERQHYQQLLRQIDQILNQYRALRDQAQYDVFISVKQEEDGHPTRDSDKAGALCTLLTGWGFRVFNSKYTPPPTGEDYEPYIIAALLSARVMIVVGTRQEYMNAPWVRNEWLRFSWLEKTEREKYGKTDRLLFCYLADGMPAGDIPAALRHKQAILEGPTANDKLKKALQAALPQAFSNETAPKSGDEEYQYVISQMDTLLACGEFDEASACYKATITRKESAFYTSVRLPLYALCARLKISFIEDLPKAQADIERENLFRLAVKRARNSERDTAWLKSLAEENKKRLSPAMAQPKDDAEALYRQGLAYRSGQGAPRDDRQAAECFRRAAELGHADAQFQYGYCWEHGTGVDRDYKQAAVWYRKAADQGNADAQNKLGVFCMNGSGLPKDHKQAVAWYRKAAVQGHASAQNNLGYCCQNGLGVPRDPAQAAEWYRQAADQGHQGGQNNLGYCFEHGIGVAKDGRQAAEWYRKAAEQGYANAQNNLGCCFEHGVGVARDERQAAVWYRRAAEQGHAYGQYHLGLCYENGVGVTKDLSQAVAWYRKAAEQGLADAQFWLGIHYRTGTGGVAKDGKMAVEWLRKAAEQGLATAQNSLGVCYDEGFGVAMDKKAAAEWYRKAAEQGLANAQFNLGVSYERGEGVAQDYGQAVALYRKAAEQDYANAQNRLGDCYYYGQGVAQDYSQAVAWYRKAADGGSVVALRNLANCYKNGWGVPADPQEARRYFQLAAAKGDEPSIAELKNVQDESNGLEAIRQAAAKGDAYAQCQLGVRYRDGTGGVARDDKKAVEWFHKAAGGGSVAAMRNLAFCYKNGIGVPADPQEANRFFCLAAAKGDEPSVAELNKIQNESKISVIHRAATQGDAAAQNLMGEIYRDGLDVHRNLTTAAYWFRKSAENGNADGQYHYSLCLKNGWGVAVNKVEENKWLVAAAQGGNKEARRYMEQQYEADKKKETWKKEEAQIYSVRQAAMNGDAAAQNRMGLFYLNGSETERNWEKAAAWFKKSAENGNANGQYNYSRCLKHGWGVAKDKAEENKWLTLAAKNGNPDAKRIVNQAAETQTNASFGTARSAAPKSAPIPSKVKIECYDNKGKLLKATTQAIPAKSSKTIEALAIDGYKAVGSKSCIVTAFDNGQTDPPVVQFTYKKKMLG